MNLTEYLTRHYACDPSIPWVAGRPASEALWRECPDASWMIRLCAKVGVRRELLVLCATGCARSVLHLVPRGEDRPRLVVEVAEAWVYGHATQEAARAAANAAYTYADDDAAYATAYAARAAAHATAYGAAYAAVHAAYAASAATVASDAADAAAVASDAADAAARAAAHAGICTREHALARYARGVREVIPWWHVADRLRAAGVEVV